MKDGVETRAITPREFSAERDVIIEALMSPNPRQRIKNKAPSKHVLDAAKDLRRLEVLYNLNLITDSEKNTEKKAIEKHLGINNNPPKKETQPTKIEQKPTAQEQPQALTVNTTQPDNQPISEDEITIPEVSSPF